MAARKEEATDYVPAVFARSSEEAEAYCQLLNGHEIPAVIGDDDAGASSRRGAGQKPLPPRVARGVPVLVPDSLLDKASEVIAASEEVGEFAGEKTPIETEEEEEFIFEEDEDEEADEEEEEEDDEEEEELDEVFEEDEDEEDDESDEEDEEDDEDEEEEWEDLEEVTDEEEEEEEEDEDEEEV